MKYLFLTHMQLFASQDISSCVDYFWIIVMFLSAVWTLILTAPIAEGPTASKWCNAKFLQIYSNEKNKLI